MYNHVGMIGRLTKDVELRYSAGENPIAIGKFTIANHREQKDEEGKYIPDFFNVTCFDKRAEWADQYLRKGTKVLVEGRVQTGSYNNKDGVKIPTFEIIASNIELLVSSKESGNNETQNEVPDAVPTNTEKSSSSRKMPFNRRPQ